MRGRVSRACAGSFMLTVLVVFMAGCSEDESPTGPSSVDVIAPSVVLDLAAVSPTTGSLALRWTATGDDTTKGTASQYDIRYSTANIIGTDTTTWWNQAIQCTGEPVPRAAGSRETFVVTGLSANTTYYYAVKVGDEKPNWSGASNVASGLTRAGSGWLALGSGVSNGLLTALTVYDGQLIAAGLFTSAGGVSAAQIAAWDGSSWSALGAGLGGGQGVAALAVYGGRLIAGGLFYPDGVPGDPSRIAAWDGSSWSALGTGLQGGSVSALTIYNGTLIAGGDFTSAGGTSVYRIAAWNGTSWSALGSGIGDPYYHSSVYALTVYNGQLIAGGDFTTAGGVGANRIAAWNGTSWSALGEGVEVNSYGAVHALAVYNGYGWLIAGGDITGAGRTPAYRIAAWNGVAWGPLHLGTPDEFDSVEALSVYNDQLIAGGRFTYADAFLANNIAAWNGLGWTALGSGMSDEVYALTFYNGQLIAGGDFSTAGAVSANGIAAWSY